MARRKKNDPRPPPGTNVGMRNRASPARLVKLYNSMTPEQRKMVEDIDFGGLLQISCHTIPADFANWLLMDCFDAESMELVLPGRGRIPVTEDVISYILGLPNSGGEVVYELEAEAIKFISSKYNIAQGTAPRIEEIFQRVKNNKDANEDFLRSWLMLAVSTFLCPTTSLHISPRCYPDIVDLDRVKSLNWSKFVVNQLKDAGSKLNTKGSVKGCVLVLGILYADSLEAPSLHIPNTTPRVAAWSRKLLNEIISLDTNRDGSFEKLKLKQSANTRVQESLFKMDDIFQFVSSKARGMAAEEKKKLSDAVGKMMCGITDVVGKFVQEVGAIRADTQQTSDANQPSSSVLRRSKRRRSIPHEEPEDEEDTDYVEPEDEVGEDDEETDVEKDEDDEDGAGQEDGKFGEDGEDGEDEGDGQNGQKEEDGEDGANGPVGEKEEEQPAKEPSPKRCRMDNQNIGSHRAVLHPISEVDDDDEADNTPLSVRLRQLREVIEPISLEVIPPATAKERRARLRLPERSNQSKDRPMTSKSGTASTHKRSKSADDVYKRQEPPQPLERSNSLDFTPSEINILKFVEEEGKSPDAEQTLKTDYLNEPGADCWDGLDEEALREIEENALKQFKLMKSQGSQGAAATSSQKSHGVRSSHVQMSTPPDLVGAEITGGQKTAPAATEIEPSSVNSSVPPVFHPAPRRTLRKTSALKSAYTDVAPRKSFICSKEVCHVYDMILKSHLHPPRNRELTSKEYVPRIIIINCCPLFIYLDELANSVKPGGDLINIVAEIGIHVIDPKGRAAFKRIMPVHLSGYLLSGDLDRAEVKRLFKKGTNNLDHRQMVMFPVLQVIKPKDLGSFGHYFLLVLNIRNRRFEVLDSLRTIEDASLKSCCDTLMEAIKHLWSEYYSESEFVMENYETVSINVPRQSNIHDCGFHMLMHAEHWDGRAVCEFNEKDMPNIRKLLTYKWLMHPGNDTAWKHKFSLK